jgi:hypothetical protein
MCEEADAERDLEPWQVVDQEPTEARADRRQDLRAGRRTLDAAGSAQDRAARAGQAVDSAPAL